MSLKPLHLNIRLINVLSNNKGKDRVQAELYYYYKSLILQRARILKTIINRNESDGYSGLKRIMVIKSI